MKMMCIKGQQHSMHTGLVAGQVYEVTPLSYHCGCAGNKDRVQAAGSVFHFPINLKCRYCGQKNRNVLYVPWGKWRFAPWNEPKVTIEEANELYAPTRLIEELL